MSQRRRREAASWPQYRREEEGGGGPPEPALSRRERHGRRSGRTGSRWSPPSPPTTAWTMHLHPCPVRGCPAGFVTNRELRESVATYVLLRSGEHERVNERNPSKASAKAPAYIYSGVILLYQLQKMCSYMYPRVGVRELVRACTASLRESTIYYAQRMFATRVIV